MCEILRRLTRRRAVPNLDEGMLAELMTARLQRLGGAPENLPAGLAAGLEVLRACLADPRLQWIFASLAAREAQAETPLQLTGMFAGRLTSIRADISFIDPAGTRWLIDIAPRAADPEAAFALRLARHVQLAQALGPTPARAAIYLPATQLFWTGSGA